MNEVALKAELRLKPGSGTAKKLRAAGKIPATLYGRAREAVSISVDARAVTHSLHGRANVLVDLEVDGKNHLTLPRQLQIHPTRGTITHIDFLEVERGQLVAVDVPIHWVGVAPGLKEGGLVEHVHTTLHVEASATEVPAAIDIDISQLDLDGSIRVNEVTLPEGVRFLMPEDEVLATCALPKVQVEAVPVEVAPVEGVPVEGVPVEGAPAAEPPK